MKSVDSLCRAESIVQIGKPSKTIIKVQECFREANNFLCGQKKVKVDDVDNFKAKNSLTIIPLKTISQVTLELH
jgi:hypothetical protein